MKWKFNPAAFRFGTLDAYSGRVPLTLTLLPPQKRDQAAIDEARLLRKIERARKRVLSLDIRRARLYSHL